jgi:hypothetical protein
MTAPGHVRLTPRTVGPRSRWTDAAALGLLVAGVCHVFAALDHLGHGVLFAAFFLVVGLTQLVVGSGLRRVRPAVAAAALAGTVALLVLYVVSRTVALDLGPHSDRPEDPDVLGTAVVICELVAVTALPTLLPLRRRRVAVNVLLAIGVALWVSWFAGVLG